jgi:hypothetical protein
VDALEKQGFAEMKTIPFMPDGETTSEQVEVVVDPRQTVVHPKSAVTYPS